MILPTLRKDLDIMLSPVTGRPGLLIRDRFRYSDTTLIVPPPLIPGLLFFDGKQTDLDLQAALARSWGDPETGNAVENLHHVLSQAGFLEDETYAMLKQHRVSAFLHSPVRQAAHAGAAYPAEMEPLRELMRRYLAGPGPSRPGLIGIAAPHVSPQYGWQSYRAAYRELTHDLQDRTFVILGTSHYGRPDKFGITRKPFATPFGTTRIDQSLVAQLEAQPAAVCEDYCHAVEHSIEFQVIFLQSIFGEDVRILPLLCGPFGKSMHAGGYPEDDEQVKRFLAMLGEIAERDGDRLFWVLGVDMAHIGMRYGDKHAARADDDQMTAVRVEDQRRIERLNISDAHGFWDLIKRNQDDLRWCGSAPFYTFMKAVPQARGVLENYQQWNIDQNSVVTFAGITFAV
jgi:MEMO1 family protein